MKNDETERLNNVLAQLTFLLEHPPKELNLHDLNALKRQVKLVRRASLSDEATALKLVESFGLVELPARRGASEVRVKAAV